MAKAPAKPKAAAGDKPAVTPAASEAAKQSQGAATEGAAASSAADTSRPDAGQDSGATAEETRTSVADPGAPPSPGASGNDTSTAPSTEAPPAGSAAGGQGEDAPMPRLFAGDIERASGHPTFERGPFADLDEALRYIEACAGALASAVGDAGDLAVPGNFIDEGRTLVALERAGALVADAIDAYEAVLDLGESEAEIGWTVEVRSRDGKPFRRAGFQFGDAWQPVTPTAEQLAAIQADPGLQTRTPA